MVQLPDEPGLIMMDSISPLEPPSATCPLQAELMLAVLQLVEEGKAYSEAS